MKIYNNSKINNVRIGGILKNSLSNGPGCRLVIFFAGCKHYCKGCQNKHLWPMDSGVNVDISKIYKVIDDNMYFIDGITFSGGEPFLQCNALYQIIKYAKAKKLNVWCYTGYTLKDLQQSNKQIISDILSNINVLVDGKFVEKLKSDNIMWRGSTNQNVIEMNEI